VTGELESLLGGGLLFCDPRFHDLNGVPPERRWRHEHRRNGRLVGVLDGVVTDGVLLSGHSAPFGGPDLVRPDPTVEDLVDLVHGALERIRGDGIREFRLRARPPVYSAAEPLLEYVLLHLGFSIEHCDLNMHVDLTAVAPDGDALRLLKDRKRRYVRAALRTPHDLVEVEGGAELTTLHSILAANRLAHGRPLPLGRDYLERMRASFPDRVRLLLLRLAGQPVAAAVVYRVLDGIDQVVHWADAEHGLVRSPMDLLAHLVLTDSLQRGARLLDLGPSSDKDGRPNPGLANFKRSVGARPGTRKVYLARLT
jgi:Acetyltransferase (GNAT) domain